MREKMFANSDAASLGIKDHGKVRDLPKNRADVRFLLTNYPHFWQKEFWEENSNAGHEFPEGPAP